MFRVDVGNGLIVAFTFKHEHFERPARLSGSSAIVKAQTMCTLEVGGAVFYDWAYCSVKDVFDKDKARKIALAKAMKQTNLDKQEREMVWERYHLRDLSNQDFEHCENIWNGNGLDVLDLGESLGSTAHQSQNESVGRASIETTDQTPNERVPIFFTTNVEELD